MNEIELIKWKNKPSTQEYMKFAALTSMICPVIIAILTILSIFIMFPNQWILPSWVSLYVIGMSFVMVLSILFPGIQLSNYLWGRKNKKKK